MDSWIETHLKEIRSYQMLIDETPEDVITEHIFIRSRMLVLIGRVAARLSEDYKKIYARRKQVHAEAYLSAARSKAAEAELAIVELRNVEAEAYGDMKRWNNAFESTQEEINALKYKVKISLADGSADAN